MLYVGILSDTHGYLPPALFDFFAPCDELWHAGDWGNEATVKTLLNFKPVKGVTGNIDGREVKGYFPAENRFRVEELEVYMTHIGGYPGKYSPGVKAAYRSKPFDIMVCGHSHMLKVIRDPDWGVMHFNPGACGVHGFHRKSTALRLRIDGKRMFELEVWEQNRTAEATNF